MRTLAIIVLYNPSLDELMITIKDLTAFNINICLVDNSEIFNDFSDYAIFDNLSVIRNSSNLGIAQAQNIGVMHGISIYDSFLFLDQDSSLSSNFVIDSLDFLNNPDMLVQVPIVKNKFTNTIYPASVINEYGLPHKVLVDSCQKYQKIDIGISSGTIVKSEVFKLNILFKEFLFIDFVDIEWFLNCRKNSIDVYQNNKIYLLHLIGGESVKILNRHILVHNENRIYYKTRNSFLLFRLGYSNIYVLHQVISSLILNALNIILLNNKYHALKMYSKGIWHGLLNKGGKQI